MIELNTTLSETDLLKTGVYKIVNLYDNKIYVGSTTQSFLKRFTQHYEELLKNKHKNSYLQNAWNKYTRRTFSFQLLEVVLDKSKVLEREQFWLDNLQPFKSNGYNINPFASGTPSMSPESVMKRSQTMKRKYASGEIVPHWKGKLTWNKGLTKENHDYSYLMVPKTKSQKLVEKWKNHSESNRNNGLPVGVYSNGKLLKIFRSVLDLQDWSTIEGNILPVSGRFKTSRKGKSIYFVSAYHVKRVLNGKIEAYKGLTFNYIKNLDKSLPEVIRVEKLGKIEEP